MATGGSRALLARDRPRASAALRVLLGAFALTALVAAYGAVPHRGPAIAAPAATRPSDPSQAVAPLAGTPRGAGRAAARRFARVPLAFAPDAAGSGFVARGKGYALTLRGGGAAVTLARGTHPAAARLTVALAGARRDMRPSGARLLPGRVNYLVGPRSRWRTGVRTFSRVHYAAAWRGIDAVFYGTASQLEYDFVVAPGADAARIGVTFGGARSVRVARDGALRLGLAGGTVRQLVPHAYQRVAGARHAVSARYVIRHGRVGIRLGAYDRARTLVIDPVLAYSTYLSGSSSDSAAGIAVDGDGQAYVAGTTSSTDLTAAGNTNAGGQDAFVTKLNAAGTAVVFTTYLGGAGSDTGAGLAIDAARAVFVGGSTASATFSGHTGGTSDGDAYVAKLAADGASVSWVAVLHSGGPDAATGVALGSGDSVYAAGWTRAGASAAFNVPGFSAIGGTDAFIAHVPASGDPAAGSAIAIGGTSEDYAYGVALDPAGDAYATGYTQSANFPAGTSGTALHGSTDAFAVEATPALDAISYSRFLGGGGDEAGNAIAVDDAGQAYVGGSTTSGDFPTAGALQASRQGATDGFVTKLDPDGAIAYSTYLGGGPSTSSSRVSGIAVTAAGNAVVTGSTDATAFPTQGAFQGSDAGGTDAFVAKLTQSGAALASSTYFGGTGNDYGYGVATGPGGAVHIAGETSSTNLPTTAGAADTTPSGSPDAFVAKLSGPPGVTTGGATPVATTTATLNGRVNPSGDATTYHFDYGQPGGALTATPDAGAGSEDVERGRSAAVDGLSPGTTYRFRVVARNSGGTSTGAFQEFTTDAAPGQAAVPPETATATPVAFETVVVTPVSGTIRIRKPGTDEFIVLRAGQEIPVGSTIDATQGVVALTSAASGGAIQTALFYQGVFKTSQLRARSFPGDPVKLVTQLTLAENPATPKAARAAASPAARAHAAAKGKAPHLWGSGKGNFRTKGHYGSATVRGTKWYTENRARSTYVRVARGVVAVSDFVRHRTVLVRAGQSIVVPGPRPRAPRRRAPRFTG